MTSHRLRFCLVGLFVFIIGTLEITQAAPPRRHRARVRPRPTRVRRARTGAKPLRHRKRIAKYRPVVVAPYYRSGGVVVVDNSDSSTESYSDELGKKDVSSQPSISKSESENIPKPAPSDANKNFANQLSYEILHLEDEGMTVVVKIDGQDTKIRMIGVAAMTRGANSDQRPRRRPPVSHRFMENMLKGEKIYIVYDSQIEETDEDGKYVAYVYRAPDGLLVNLEAIRQGFGVVDTSYDFDDKKIFQFYNDRACKLGKGIWSRRKDRPGELDKDSKPGSKPD
jgi:endonuclease YncB( thermonuclease family)